jgi:hypothetical protein
MVSELKDPSLPLCHYLSKLLSILNLVPYLFLMFYNDSTAVHISFSLFDFFFIWGKEGLIVLEKFDN